MLLVMSRARIAVRAFSTTPTAIIAGAGESTGAAIAKHFASKGLCVHGARRRPAADAPIPPALVEPVRAVDFRDGAAVEAFVAGVEARGPVALAVHNIGANVRFSVEDTSARVFRKTWELAALSALHFAHALGPRMAARGRGTLIFAGATASVRGGAGFAAFAAAMHAKRALAQSLARELGPRGVHVAHVVIDGPVDTPFVRELVGEAEAVRMAERGALIEPSAIAESYWALHAQPRTAWTHELDLRPYCEKF